MRHFHPRSWMIPVAVILTLTLSVCLVDTAAAHERRKIAGDKAEAVVGWLNEPSYVDQPNGVSFVVTNPATKAPIEGLEKTVKVEVTKGGATRTYDLRARFGQPGAYTADIVPTSTGDYTFRFTGEVEGVTIDEKFESGPGRFGSIESMSKVQFPAPQPTTGELQRELAEARAATDAARTVAFAGLGAGLLGLLLAGATMLRRRPRTGGVQSATVPRP